MKKRWAAAGILLVVSCAAAGLEPQDKKREAQLRSVRGAVVDKDENPVSAAVVFLKNLKTTTVKTYISDEEGQYRFSGLDPNVDYQVHAEHLDSVSPKRTISSFDTRKELVINLKVSKKKEEKK